MITYKTIQIEREVFDKFICDKCKNEITDPMELQESYSIKFIGGYNSIFGDSSEIECDLCQHCLHSLIQDFYRITN